MPTRVGFVGLGAMGEGMARTLLQNGFDLKVFDVRSEAADRLAELGAARSATVRECAEGVEVLVVAVVNAHQVAAVLLDEAAGAVTGGFRGTCVVCATVPASFAEETSAKVAKLGARYVDAPMSGGTIKAGAGQLTFMAGAEESALQSARSVLEAMGKVYVIGSKAGQGSSMKMVNQLLAGSHIALAAEAMALGAKAGLDTRQVFEVITSAAGNSWMFENRVPHMLDDDPTPHSAVDIWTKDFGIVLDEAKRLGSPCPMAAQAMQQFVAAKGLGLGSSDDSFVVKVYETLSGAKVARPRSADAADSSKRARLS